MTPAANVINVPAVAATAKDGSDPMRDANPQELVEPHADRAAGVTPEHDMRMAAEFLACLDPNADRFTFQFFSDGPKKFGEIIHGTLEDVWPKVRTLNTMLRRVGVFVTVNETDLSGRRTENIVRPRALFADADTPEQIKTCMEEIAGCDAAPSIAVKSGRGLHFYWLSSDIPLDQFSSLQRNMIAKLGTDPAINDLPRVMRLPGTLHLKDEAAPRLVKLCKTDAPLRHWNVSELATKFGLSRTEPLRTNNVLAFSHVPAWAAKGRPSTGFADLPAQSLADGLEPNIEEIRSAVEVIPSSAIETEQEWMKFARSLAHPAAIFNKLQEPLWEILDTASRPARGYDQVENRRRFERYIREARSCETPITLASLFHMAAAHRKPSPACPMTNSVTAPGVASRAVPMGSLPLVPPKRHWLHGTDLVRGAVSVLVAPGGRAKSTWLLSCALACASGRPLLGSHVFGGPLRVLCLSTEDGISEIALRLRAAMKHHGLTDADVPGLYVIGADGWGLPLLQADGSRAVLDRRGIDALAAELNYTKPDVLIIDPLITVMGGVSANDNAAAALLMGQLTGLATTRHIAIALAHHAAKGRDPASAESAMGAASFINLARVALAIEPLDEKNAGAIGLAPWDAKTVFRVIGTKQNFAPPNTKDRWFRVLSVDMPNAEPPIYMNGDQVAVVEPFLPGVSTAPFPDQIVRDALLAVSGANPPLSPSRRSSERYAAPVIASAIKAHRGGQASEMDGKAVLDHLLSAGLVGVNEVKVLRPGKGSDLRKGLVVTAAGNRAVHQMDQVTPANPTPQSPQSPADPSRDHAGGDPLGPPQRQGGCGGNAGCRNNEVDAPREGK